MLKHVSSSNLSPYKVQRCLARDTVSLSSSLSFGSSGAQEPLSSRSSSTSSLHDVLAQRPPKSTIKVYTKVLCADMEYKTLCISQQTTSKDIVRMLLSKFKMKHRDPNLFYLTMEVWMRKTGIPIRSVVVLEDEAHPAELQACHPRGESKFSMKMRRGGLVKVFGGSCLMAGSLYKSLLVSERTCVSELIQLVLHCYNSTESHEKFSLYEVCCIKEYERRLHPSEFPLQIQLEWPGNEHFAFQLRRNVEGVQRRFTANLCEGHYSYSKPSSAEIIPERSFEWNQRKVTSAALGKFLTIVQSKFLKLHKEGLQKPRSLWADVAGFC